MDVHLSSEQAESILTNLEDIRDKLTLANARLGYLERYNAMKREITEEGWSAVCAKYHPDINIDDPAAHELFQFYKFVYETMSR
jgi:hypothetical protein